MSNEDDEDDRMIKWFLIALAVGFVIFGASNVVSRLLDLVWSPWTIK